MASNGNEPVDSAAVSAEADVLYEKGVAAIKSGAMEEAIELLAKALELKTTAHGEEAVECAPAYYKYGCALFYKAQDENTVFGKQAQAQADAKDEAARKASGSGAADEGEACDDADDAPEGDAAKDGDAEAEEEEEEDDMELAWKLIENARLIYEEAEDHPIELANCYETLGEINTEHSNFKEALEDLERCLAILETELDDDDRRIAGVLCSMSVAHQMLDEYEKALKGCTRAIGVCRARVKRLKSSDEAAVEAVKASLAPGATTPEDRSRRPRRNSTRSRRCSAISPRARRNFAGSSARITTRANRSKRHSPPSEVPLSARDPPRTAPRARRRAEGSPRRNSRPERPRR